MLDHTRALWDDLRGQSLFLTGGTGFVGTWLLESLLRANDAYALRARVVVLTRNAKRYRERSPHLAGQAAVTLLEGNIADFEFPEGPFPFVVHAATGRAVVPDAAHPLGVFSADVEGTQRVLEFARTHGVRRLLFTSSGAVYGRQPSGMTHIPEAFSGAPSTVEAPSAYGEAKRVSEYMCAMYARVYGFDATIARLFAFVGPLLPLDANYAVGNFIGDALAGRPVRIHGDGTPYRSYLYAADLAVWLWTILFRGKACYPYNVGSSHDLTIADLARTVARVVATGTEVQTAELPTPGVPAMRYVPCTTRAESELGLQTWISMEQGVRRTSDWHRSGGGG